MHTAATSVMHLLRVLESLCKDEIDKGKMRSMKHYMNEYY